MTTTTDWFSTLVLWGGAIISTGLSAFASVYHGVCAVICNAGSAANSNWNTGAAAGSVVGAGEAGMTPDLGNYAAAVLYSYAASVALIVVLVGLSIWQGARVKRALREVEERQEKKHG